MATGWSVISNQTDLSEGTILQDFAVTGGLGDYVDTVGSISNDLNANPGLNTFTFSFGESDEVAAGLPSETFVTGFIPPDSSQTEILRGYSSILSPDDLAVETGNFGLACPSFNNPDFEVFNPCLLYFYFHGDEGIGSTTDAIFATGWSVIESISDLSGSTPLLQKFAITGGLGKYAGATGTMDNNYNTNAGFNTFTAIFGSDSRRRELGTRSPPENPSRALQGDPTLTVYTSFIPETPGAVDALAGYGDIFSDPSQSEVIGSFGLACLIINEEPDIAAIYNPCLLLMYFHGDSGIATTEDAIMASGWSVLGDLTDLTVQPVLQDFAIIGGLGMYAGARGWTRNDFLTNPGVNTFSVYLGSDSAPTTTEGPAPTPEVEETPEVGDAANGIWMTPVATLALFTMLFA